MAVLSGARNAKNTYLSQNIVDRMKNIFPHSNDRLLSASILLANVYASSGNIDMASSIRIELNKSGAKKTIGISRTEIDGKILVNLKIFFELKKIFI